MIRLARPGTATPLRASQHWQPPSQALQTQHRRPSVDVSSKNWQHHGVASPGVCLTASRLVSTCAAVCMHVLHGCQLEPTCHHVAYAPCALTVQDPDCNHTCLLGDTHRAPSSCREGGQHQAASLSVTQTGSPHVHAQSHPHGWLLTHKARSVM